MSPITVFLTCSPGLCCSTIGIGCPNCCAAAVLLQNNMNQRAVRLVVASNSSGAVTLRMPPNEYIAQPGWFMLFLLNGDVPCTQARWIQLRL
jgi:hypothetical protein